LGTQPGGLRPSFQVALCLEGHRNDCAGEDDDRKKGEYAAQPGDDGLEYCLEVHSRGKAEGERPGKEREKRRALCVHAQEGEEEEDEDKEDEEGCHRDALGVRLSAANLEPLPLLRGACP